MTVEEIVENTNFDDIDIDPSQLEFKTNVRDGDRILSGFFLRGTDTPAGIARAEEKGYSIYEGFYQNGECNGYGRKIWYHGGYYIGEWKDFKSHGKGKRVYNNGTDEEGRWERGTFKGAE